MLEARIQQLQSDVVLDVQQVNVQFVKAPSYGRSVTPGRGPRDVPQEKSDIPKSGPKSIFLPSRWMEKLSQEKKNKLEKQEHLQQEIQIKAKGSSTVKSKRSKSSSMLPGTTHKTISTTIKTQKSRSTTKLSEKVHAALSTRVSAADTARLSKQKQNNHINEAESQKEQTAVDAKCRTVELAAEGKQDSTLKKQVRTSLKIPEHKRAREESICRDIQLRIYSYLEACVFVGDIDRAHKFLLSQHRVRGRRKHLNTDIYNIMMRVLAKKVSSESYSTIRTF